MIRNSLSLLLVLACLGLCLDADRASADWINLSGAENAPNVAEIHVLDDQIRLVLEVYIGELNRFEGLVPNDWLKGKARQRPSYPARMRRFSETTFQFVTETGRRLPAQLERVEHRQRRDREAPFAGMINPFTRQALTQPPADKRVLYAEIAYSFGNRRPRSLIIVPPLDAEGRALTTIGFIAFHKLVPITDFRYLDGPAHLRLDWEDPWESRFDNPGLKRHHSSALMSFLYVGPYEVRHEVLTRVKDLGQWMDLDLRGDHFIEFDELAPLKQRVGAFFLGHNPVVVNDEALEPMLGRIHYVKVGLEGIESLEKPQRLEISTAMIGVILRYFTQGIPRKVSVDWELFTDRIRRVPVTMIDPAGPLPSFVTPRDNRITWNNFLKKSYLPDVGEIAVSASLTTRPLPLLSLLFLLALVPVGWWAWRRIKTYRPFRIPLLVGAGLLLGAGLAVPLLQVSVPVPGAMGASLSRDQARGLLAELLWNLYRAFEFRAQEEVYDKLALSVSEGLLADIYRQHRKSFAVQRAGGAQAKVKAVEILELETKRLDSSPLRYAFRSRWTAQGTVGQWGHVYMLKNRFDAVLTVAAVDGIWKITGLKLLDEQRVEPDNRPAEADVRTVDMASPS